MRLYKSRAIKTRGEGPHEIQGGLVLHVKELEDHRAAGFECSEPGQCFRYQETLNRGFLAVEIGTEIEPAVGRVDIGQTCMSEC